MIEIRIVICYKRGENPLIFLKIINRQMGHYWLIHMRIRKVFIYINKYVIVLKIKRSMLFNHNACTKHNNSSLKVFQQKSLNYCKINVTVRSILLGPGTENEMALGVEVVPEKRKEMTQKKKRRVNHGKEKEATPGKEKETTPEKGREVAQERKVSPKRERGVAREKESAVSHERDGENTPGKETVHVTASETGPETDVDQGMQCDFVRG